MILAGVAVGAMVDRKWLVLPVFAATMLLLHNLHGWYPLLPLLRRWGIRTEEEIAYERYQLKAARGDFRPVDQETDTRAKSRRALESAWV